jgi:hypothetical protein
MLVSEFVCEKHESRELPGWAITSRLALFWRQAGRVVAGAAG